MKVFISWSGNISRTVAEVLREWLPSVIQAIQPYVSSEDIDKGARWSADISHELDASNYGILCVTRENLGAPWLNFEAGALSKSFDKSRVSPFLFKMDRTEVTGPLLQFQSTIYEREDVRKLLRSINASFDPSLDDARLNTYFDTWWPSLQKELDTIGPELEASDDHPTTQKRSVEDVLDEVLSLVREQQKILSVQGDPILYRESMERSREAEAREKMARMRVAEIEYMIDQRQRYAAELESSLTAVARGTFDTLRVLQSRLARAHESLDRPQQKEKLLANLEDLRHAVVHAIDQLKSVRQSNSQKRADGVIIK